MPIYTFAIYLYMICASIAAIFNKKARLLVKGHRAAFRILREKIRPEEKYIWVHAASLGEFEQGRTLIERIREAYPQYRILLTFFSPSGYEVRKNYEGADVVCYLPFDTYLNACKFLRLVHPCMAFFIKYEFWQNYLTELHKKGIPTFSVSSIFRPNQIFFRWYGKRYANVLRCFTHLFVQNETSSKLLKGLGINNATVVGDTRFDRVMEIAKAARKTEICDAFIKGMGDGDYLLVAGSSWPQDEKFIIDYFNNHPEQKLILAPHVVSDKHLDEIDDKLQRPAVRYSCANPESVHKSACLIIDCYGMLSSIYSYGNMAYVGGGFGAGIHNVPEAAVHGLPVVIGPNNKNFKEAQDLLKKGGCFEIQSAEEYASIMDKLATDKSFRENAGNISRNYISENAGAVDSIFNSIDFSNIPAYGTAAEHPEYTGMKK